MTMKKKVYEIPNYDSTQTDSFGEIVLYQPNNDIRLEVRIAEESVWLSQAQMAVLFGTRRQAITKHLKTIFDTKELERYSTSSILELLQKEGNRKIKRHVPYYNLKMIIAIGLRVKSSIATAFRIWANDILEEYMVKGFALDDKRLEDPEKFGKDYFDELYSRIKAIRASEKRFYIKVLEIYSTSIDYNKDDKQTINFFKTVQNKLHYAISGETAAELVYHRADASKDNMGLTSWSGPQVQKSDVIIAKNYLSKEELDSLNQIVNMYLDHAERMAKENIPMHMSDWIEALDEFLKFERADILVGAGKISHALAIQKAHKEYEKYDANRQIEMSKDIDKKLLDILNKK